MPRHWERGRSLRCRSEARAPGREAVPRPAPPGATGLPSANPPVAPGRVIVIQGQSSDPHALPVFGRVTMNVAVISDTHGNLRALEAVLEHLDATGPFDEIVMAGD